MFTLHDVIDLAVQIEENAERVYRDAAARAQSPSIQQRLGWLADQEREHAAWLMSYAERFPDEATEPELVEMGRGMLRQVLGSHAFDLTDTDLASLGLPREVLKRAIQLEEDTVVFYEMLDGFMADPSAHDRLKRIIAEEQSHAESLGELLNG